MFIKILSLIVQPMREKRKRTKQMNKKERSVRMKRLGGPTDL